jgi:DMSO/TMAO reductase YedYZ molybdopterin-dependent catalytic subunit
VVENLVVLDLGVRPAFDPATWRFTVRGEVENQLTFTWQEFLALPTAERIADFHCVTGWSRLDNRWEGVLFGTLAEMARPRPDCVSAMIESADRYTTSMPLGVLMDDDVLFAYHLDGEPLPPDNGGPLRLVVPKRYAYKSAKWAVGLTFLTKHQPGYWEKRGYSDSADPWKEERYA